MKRSDGCSCWMTRSETETNQITGIVNFFHTRACTLTFTIYHNFVKYTITVCMDFGCVLRIETITSQGRRLLGRDRLLSAPPSDSFSVPPPPCFSLHYPFTGSPSKKHHWKISPLDFSPPHGTWAPGNRTVSVLILKASVTLDFQFSVR